MIFLRQVLHALRRSTTTAKMVFIIINISWHYEYQIWKVVYFISKCIYVILFVYKIVQNIHREFYHRKIKNCINVFNKNILNQATEHCKLVSIRHVALYLSIIVETYEYILNNSTLGCDRSLTRCLSLIYFSQCGWFLIFLEMIWFFLK